jgi:ABC-2 type transport system permease protein
MKKALFTVFTFAKLNTRRFFRDRVALFFGIMFPVIFLFIFGGIFGRDDGGASFTIAVINQSDTTLASDFANNLRDNKIPQVKFKVDKEVSTYDQAREKMVRGQIDATVILPPDFGRVQHGHGGAPTGNLQLRYTQNNAQAGQTLGAVLDGVFAGMNEKYVHVQKPFTVDAKQTSDKGQRAFDYTFAGLLGFSIIGLGIFGPVNVFPELKKQGILRRLHTTPLRVWQYFTAMALSQSTQGLVAIGILFAVAIGVFHLTVRGNFLEIIPFIVLSIIMVLGIGLALGGWAKNERQAAPLANLVVFPMLFLSGTFFPRFLMPEWLQKLSAFLPLTPVIDGLRLMTTEGKHLIDILPQVGLVAVWLIVIYLVAFRVFRWE